MRTVLDGDAGRAQRVTDRVGTCEILGLARFGTFRKLFGNQLVERVMLGGIGSGTSRTTCGTVGNPRLRQRIQAQRVEHRTHVHQRLANLGLRHVRIGAVGQLRQQRVAGTDRRENRSGSTGNINIVVHCGNEISRQSIGRNRNDLFARRLPANGGTVYMTYKLPYGGDFNTGKISDFVDEYNAANPDAPMVFDYVAAKTSIPWLEIIFYVAMLGSIGMLFMSMYRGGAGGGTIIGGRGFGGFGGGSRGGGFGGGSFGGGGAGSRW